MNIDNYLKAQGLNRLQMSGDELSILADEIAFREMAERKAVKKALANTVPPSGIKNIAANNIPISSSEKQLAYANNLINGILNAENQYYAKKGTPIPLTNAENNAVQNLATIAAEHFGGSTPTKTSRIPVTPLSTEHQRIVGNTPVASVPTTTSTNDKTAKVDNQSANSNIQEEYSTDPYTFALGLLDEEALDNIINSNNDLPIFTSAQFKSSLDNPIPYLDNTGLVNMLNDINSIDIDKYANRSEHANRVFDDRSNEYVPIKLTNEQPVDRDRLGNRFIERPTTYDSWGMENSGSTEYVPLSERPRDQILKQEQPNKNQKQSGNSTKMTPEEQNEQITNFIKENQNQGLVNPYGTSTSDLIAGTLGTIGTGLAALLAARFGRKGWNMFKQWRAGKAAGAAEAASAGTAGTAGKAAGSASKAEAVAEKLKNAFENIGNNPKFKAAYDKLADGLAKSFDPTAVNGMMALFKRSNFKFDEIAQRLKKMNFPKEKIREAFEHLARFEENIK